MALSAEHEQRVEAAAKLIASLYDKAVAYTNVVIIAGYAAFFAVWANTKSYLGKRETLWAALLVLISILCFVSWETAKMYITATSLKNLRDEVLNAAPETFTAKLDQLKLAEARLIMKLLPVWRIIVGVCVVLGLSAGAILINGFLRELIY